MTFERLQPKTADEIPLLAEVLDDLRRNDHHLTRMLGPDSYGHLQLYWPGHCFTLSTTDELRALREALEFELMVWSAAMRKLYV